jgi:pimeloyl-ACP methyl ester carboxylesterase
MRRTIVLVTTALVAGSLGCLDPRAPGNLVPATVADDPGLPSYTLRDGVKLHLEALGDASHPVLIVLHGGPGADYRALRALEPLSERYRIIFWDQRGAGLSERVPASQLSIGPYLGDLDELVEHFSPGRKVTLVGHSFGGAFAAAYVNRFPGKVEQLALLDPSALLGGAADEQQIDFLAFWDEGVNEYLKYDSVGSTEDEELKDFRFYRVLASQGHELVLERKLWRGGVSAAQVVTNNLARTGYNFVSNSISFPTRVLFLAPPDGAGPFGASFQLLQCLHYKSWEVVTLRDTTHLSMVGSPRTLEELRRYLVRYRP